MTTPIATDPLLVTRKRKRLLLAVVVALNLLALVFLLRSRGVTLRGYTLPASPAEARAALGPLDGLPAPLRRALTPGDDDKPLPLPMPGDWLSMHPEPGQTFAQYAALAMDRPDARRRVIYLLPLGDFPAATSPSLELLREYLAAFFSLEARVLPARHPAAAEFSPRVNPFTNRRQWLAPAILESLTNGQPADAYCVVAVTMTDLYPDPKWNYCFGLASWDNYAGVYSFARFDPAFFDEPRPPDFQSAILRHSIQIMTHETGHILGMHHCVYYRCLLNGANNFSEMARTPLHLCPVCLRKLQYRMGCDLARRDELLGQFYAVHEMPAEARRVENRLRRLREAIP